MKLTSFTPVLHAPIDLSKINLSDLPCGLFRCPLNEAKDKLPELAELYASAPVTDPENWELDIKIHMLMKDQYPCIPNWHCDNVPRVNGKLRYDLTTYCCEPLMYLWVSDEPTTEFFKYPTEVGRTLDSHGDIAPLVAEYNIETVKVPPMTWVSFDQRTPHRGTASANYTWRVFARLTHKSIAPVRSAEVIRRHCQVYLDASNFTW